MKSNTLPENLILKTVNTEEDIARIAAFNKFIHEGYAVDLFVNNLITRHPSGKNQSWMYIEDIKKKKIVSSGTVN